MNAEKLPHWLQPVVASLGGLGLFVIAFLDSSVLTFPVINDLLVVRMSMRNPARMPYYALMATLGSVFGCILLYFIARKGGEMILRKHTGPRTEHLHDWMSRNGFLGVLIAALLPPPTPFKVFVVAAGVVEIPLRSFTLALLIARSFRYFGEGFLAVRYGEEATHYLVNHKLASTLVAVGVVSAAYLISHLVRRRVRLH